MSGTENISLINFIHSSHIPMWLIDKSNFAFLDVNEAALKLLSYSKEELLGNEISKIQFKDSQDSFISILLNHNNTSNNRYESALKTKQHQILRFHFSIFEFYQENKILSLISLEDFLLDEHSLNDQENLFLKEYDSELKAFFNNSGSILVLFNKNLEVTAFNPQAEIYGRDLFRTEFAIGKNVVSLLPPIFQSDFTDFALKALDGIETSNREIKIPETNLWWSLRYYPLYNNHGEIFGASFTAIDISERKKSEALLIQSEARFKSLSENGSDIIAMYDKNFRTLYRSGKAFEITGRKPDQVDNDSSILKYLHPQDRVRLKPVLTNLLGNPGYKVYERFRWLHEKGHYIWLEGTITNLLHEENIRAIVTNMHDVTEDVKMMESQNLLASIVDSTEDAVISCNLDGKIISWNKGAEHLLGFTKAEVLNDDFKLFIPTDYILSESTMLEDVKKGGFYNQIQSKRIQKNGTIIDVSLTMSPIRNYKDEIVGISKIIRDVTLLNKNKKDLELLIKELSASNKELKQFSYITSHNLRGPLTNLMSIIKLMDLNKITDQTTRTFIEGFISSTYSLKNTLDDLINILIIKENTNQDLTFLNLEEHLLKVLNSISNTIENSGLQLEYDFKAVNVIRFNAAYLDSILINLISNAIKYRRPDVIPSLKITSFNHSNKVSLSFSDNGLGMDWTKVKDKIFGLYQKFHRHPDSKGIGLYLVNSQVTALGGSIDVKTAINEGTTFTIHFNPS